MRTYPTPFRRLLTSVLIGGISCLSTIAWAGALPYISGTDNMLKYTSLPVTSVDSAQPQAMIQLAKDHQLFLKAYNDYTDLDGDGTIENVYRHDFRYYGYFDDGKCYNYDSIDQRFEPAAFADGSRYCNGSTWSGNFLNWVSMGRIDVVRKILFGGRRYVDESVNTTGTDLTVLERTYLPNDAHSWAKYYNGSDINKLTPFNPPTSSGALEDRGLTICNTTVDPGFNDVSDDVTDPPLIRVAQGNYSLWASNERWQCLWSGEKSASNANDASKSGIPAHSSNPSFSSDRLGLGDYIARVQVCVVGLEDGDRCKQYPSGTLKPIGLLQEYGDTERMWFGMTAGTYSKNKGGADIMKNVGPFTDEVNVNDDGRLIKVAGLKDAAGNTVGNQSSSSNGIANALSLYRIIKYQHSDGTYGTNGNNTNNCTFRLAEFSDGTCQNWGNPFGEGFHSVLRYYANKSPSGDFRSNDSNEIPGLNPPQSYKFSLDENNACASLNVVAFNNSTISYDGDQLDDNSDGVGSLGSTLSSGQLADLVGAGEGIHGKTFFVGENGATTQGDAGHQVCTAKTVSSLGDVRGLCPTAPRLEGTFRIAGLAYYAHTNDINADVAGVQTVKTYAVNLASGTPEIDIPVPGSAGKSVRILPACQNIDLKKANGSTVSGLSGACSIVDFKIVEPHAVAGGIGTGKYYVNWENGEQGGDYDQDMWGVLSYAISDTKIEVTTDVIAYSGGGARMGFGYVISGTTEDGAHFHSGAGDSGGFVYNDPTSATDCPSGCDTGDAPTSYTYTLGSSTASFLQDPLFYAAKWGAFNDIDGDGTPNQVAEWDTVDEQGNPGADGIPDTYFYAVEPRQLEAQLRRVFDQIIGQVASGTAAAVVANAREGEGAVYQALFEPTRSDSLGNEVRWIGTLHSLWVDSDGYLREDDGDAILETYASDPVVELFFDESNADPAQQRTKLRRYPGDPRTTTPQVLELEKLNTLWNAREQLSSLVNTDTQRTYSSTADNGRHILTHLDFDFDGKVDSGEVVDFVSSSFGDGRYGILNAPDKATATTLVEYVRGKDFSSPLLRPRTLDYDGDNTVETMRLGDIVQSTPTVVAAPAEAFDLLYDDASYAAFRQKYGQRRNMIYVGANDGMLHAFNGGCFDPSGPKFTKTGGGCSVAHPLGSELWAYVPYNLLPHLTWTTNTEYTHVWYVDGKPRVFDARIFSADTDHPDGWGTVLVVGFQFGGGDITLPASSYSDGFSDFAVDSLPKTGNKQNLKLGSAYVVLDITNPEKPPTVLAEITHDNLGFSTSFPTVIAVRDRGCKVGGCTDDRWYLTFGNGPDNLDSITTNLIDAESKQSGKLFLYDLESLSFVSGESPIDLGTNATKGARNSFVGDPVTVDWDLDFKADAVFFGTVGGDAEAPEGKLFKLDVKEEASAGNWLDPVVLLDPGNPVTSTPSVTFDEFGNRWVLGGTGRFYSDADKNTADQQALFGVIDVADTASANNPIRSYSSLVDVTSARVATTGVVDGVSYGGNAITDHLTLVDTATQASGWKLLLGTPPAERNVTSTSLLGDILFASAFTPSSNLCGGQGRSELYGLFFKTGAPSPDIPTFSTQTATIAGETVEEAIRSVELGVGLASAPSLHAAAARDNRGLTVFTQTSTGAIERREGAITQAARSGEISWQETYICE